MTEQATPKAPDHLGTEAKAVWQRVIGQLVEAGLYEEIDMAGVALYCQAWGRLVKAIGELQLSGGPLQVSAGETPAASLSPWFVVASEAMAQVEEMLSGFFDVDAAGCAPGKVPRRGRIKTAVIMAPERTVLH